MKHRLLCTQQRTSVLLVFISAVLALVALSIPTKSAEAATAKIVNGTFSYAMKEIYDCSESWIYLDLNRLKITNGNDCNKPLISMFGQRSLLISIKHSLDGTRIRHTTLPIHGKTVSKLKLLIVWKSNENLMAIIMQNSQLDKLARTSTKIFHPSREPYTNGRSSIAQDRKLISILCRS